VSQRPESGGERGVPEALRDAIQRTLDATAGPTASTRERAADLLDDVARLSGEARDELARRGQEAGAQLARRSQEAGAELARRGQEAGAELTKQLEALERRLASLEEALRTDQRSREEKENPPAPAEDADSGDSHPRAEG
jgi:polyhydroxyalkanoate synthesis regulator phasin